MQNKFLKKCCIILLAVILAGCETVPPTRLPPGAKISLKELCDKENITLVWDSVTQVVVINRGEITARSMIGSNIVLVSDASVLISAPVDIVDSIVCVPSDFKTKVIDLMTGKPPDKTFKDYSFRLVKKVVLDPGHGGKDPGAISKTGLKEKQVVLDIAKRVKRILKEEGIDVVMTRDTDVFITLQRRTEIASSTKADLYVSIHANSNPSRSMTGVEVYSARNLSYLEKDETQREINHRRMFKTLKMKHSDNDVEKIISDMLYSHKQGESAQLAKIIADNTANTLEARNWGAKSSRFFVLRNTLIPAVLVEVGFLSNPKEDKLLKSEAYRQKIARGIAEGILKYANKRK